MTKIQICNRTWCICKCFALVYHSLLLWWMLLFVALVKPFHSFGVLYFFAVGHSFLNKIFAWQILLSTECDAFKRQHLGRRLKCQSPLLSAERLYPFIKSSNTAVADLFISQVPGILFTMSFEAFDSVTAESDRALALTSGKTDEGQEESSFLFCLYTWSTLRLKEFPWSHTGSLWQSGEPL